MITTIVTACATLAVAAATGYYAISTHKMLDEMRKDRERPRIVGRVKEVLTPFINKLDHEIAALEHQQYRWVHSLQRSDKLATLEIFYPPETKIVLSDLLRESPHIKTAIAEHSEKVKELQKRLSRLDQAIFSGNFEGKCQAFIDEFNNNAKESNYPPVTYSDDAPEYFVSFIIDNVKELPQSHEYRNFWDRYGDALRKIRENEGVNQRITEIEEASKELEHIAKLLKGELEQLKEQYYHDYNLSSEELREQGSCMVI